MKTLRHQAPFLEVALGSDSILLGFAVLACCHGESASHLASSWRSLARATRTRPLTCARPPSVDRPRLRGSWRNLGLFMRNDGGHIILLVVEPTPLKNMSQIGNLPQVGVKIKNL